MYFTWWMWGSLDRHMIFCRLRNALSRCALALCAHDDECVGFCWGQNYRTFRFSSTTPQRSYPDKAPVTRHDDDDDDVRQLAAAALHYCKRALGQRRPRAGDRYTDTSCLLASPGGRRPAPLFAQREAQRTRARDKACGAAARWGSPVGMMIAEVTVTRPEEIYGYG
jgi:hypothetical protein